MLTYYLLIALSTGLSSTYGYSELMCGDIGHPRPCSKGAVTASGEVFDPSIPSAAIFAPTWLRMRVRQVYLQVGDGPCVLIRVNDKGNPRFIGKRAFDLSPAAVRALTGSASPYWMGTVKPCQGEEL